MQLCLLDIHALIEPWLSHYSIARLDINSTVYKKGAIVILAAKEEDLPVFGLIQHVITVNVETYFL